MRVDLSRSFLRPQFMWENSTVCAFFLCECVLLLVTTILLSFVQRLIGMKFLFLIFCMIFFYFAAHIFQNENLYIIGSHTRTHVRAPNVSWTHSSIGTKQLLHRCALCNCVFYTFPSHIHSYINQRLVSSEPKTRKSWKN